jgi:serine/threonine protein kinase
MCQPSCPDDDTLSRFLSGNLPPGHRAEMESHIEQCARCSTRLNHLWESLPRARPAPAGPSLGTPDWARDWIKTGTPLLQPKLKPPLREGDLGRLARYRVIEKVGEGASSIVFHGYDTVLERHVILKVFRPGVPGCFSRKIGFKREARAIARISNDRVVRILDCDRDGPTRFLVQPYTEGTTLRQFLDKRAQSLDRLESLRLALEIVAGLEAIHASGLCHRDLKPENILVRVDGREEAHAMLIDLGLSTLPVTHAGTAGYMAPEIEAGHPPWPEGDLYSLGRVLEHLKCASSKPWTTRQERMVYSLTDTNPGKRTSLERVRECLKAREISWRWVGLVPLFLGVPLIFFDNIKYNCNNLIFKKTFSGHESQSVPGAYENGRDSGESPGDPTWKPPSTSATRK